WDVVGLAQIAVAVGTALLVYEIGRRVASSWVGVVAAVLTTVHPYLIWHDVHLNREILDQFLAAAIVLATLLLTERPIFGFGALCGRRTTSTRTTRSRTEAGSTTCRRIPAHRRRRRTRTNATSPRGSTHPSTSARRWTSSRTRCTPSGSTTSGRRRSSLSSPARWSGNRRSSRLAAGRRRTRSSTRCARRPSLCM